MLLKTLTDLGDYMAAIRTTCQWTTNRAIANGKDNETSRHVKDVLNIRITGTLKLEIIEIYYNGRRTVTFRRPLNAKSYLPAALALAKSITAPTPKLRQQ